MKLASDDTLRLDGRYAVAVLALLCLSNAFYICDRLLVGIAQEPIKNQFELSDFQLGLLGGPAFAILYSILSLPIARLAERGNRVSIVAAALATFSAMSALCGIAGSYIQLLLARIGVSVGEAGASPPALSLISDYFRPSNRATAMAVFAVGGPAGALLASIGGGWIVQTYGWRASFLTFGVLGFVLSIALKLVVRETRAGSASTSAKGFMADLRLLMSRRSFLHVCAAGIFAAFCVNFIVQYMASFLMRVHHMPLAKAATIVGLAAGICGMLGAFFGGFLADRVSRRWPSARTLVAAAAFVVAAGAFATAFHAPLSAAVPLIFLGSLCMNCYPGISYAAASAVVPPAMRATAIAFFALAGNLFGYALGPPLLGRLSDFAAAMIMRRSGIDSLLCHSHPHEAICAASQGEGLRLALTVASFLLLGGALHFWLASRSAARDRWDESQSDD